MIYWVKFVIGFTFTFFATWLAVDAIKIFIQRRRLKATAFVPKVHSHSWRKITPFAKQCKDCKTIEVAPTAPEGLEEYLTLMATAKDRRETMLHAEEYKFHDQRTQGWTCPACRRVIPNLSDIPRSPFVDGVMKPECPYCGVELLPPEQKFIENDLERIGSIIRRKNQS